MAAGKFEVFYRDGKDNHQGNLWTDDVEQLEADFIDHLQTGSPKFIQAEYTLGRGKHVVIRLESVHTIIFEPESA